MDDTESFFFVISKTIASLMTIQYFSYQGTIFFFKFGYHSNHYTFRAMWPYACGTLVTMATIILSEQSAPMLVEH